MYPKVYLAIDNCFASKRWTSPEQWSQIISDMGVFCVEASADTELDPLYMGREYLADWPKAVRNAQAQYGTKVCNLYSGHGTYSTLGITHTDPRVRRNMLDNWFKPLIDTAAQLDAGVGFYAHCFTQEIIQDAKLYKEYVNILLDGLTELNLYAAKAGCKYLALEQMYSPNQIPFTMDGAKLILQEVTAQSGVPFYFTEDLGHHHTKFIQPTAQDIANYIQSGKEQVWLGNSAAYEAYYAALAHNDSSPETCKQIIAFTQQSPQLFNNKEDSDCYTWLEKMGCYSPIIHLQQTDGTSSGHKTFTAENNRWGKIDAQKVLAALKKSYEQPDDPNMPPKCSEIYLTLELFSGTAQTHQEILTGYRESAQYWRDAIAVDGMTLDQLI